MISEVEEHNLKQINNLNQRGGRMLSIIDLLDDGTVDLDLAGFLYYMMQNRASFLTAANPSGTGKTTLMGAMLNLLDQEIRIKTLTSAPRRSNIKENNCLLVHEIGQGPYYSYLWGEEAKKFFASGEEVMIASCIHADTLKELEQLLFSSLEISRSELLNLDLVLFMQMEGTYFNPQRRVFRVYGTLEKEREQILLYEWNKENDNFKEVYLTDYLTELARRKGIPLSQVKAGIKEGKQLIEQFRNQGINKLEEIRLKLTAEIDE